MLLVLLLPFLVTSSLATSPVRPLPVDPTPIDMCCEKNELYVRNSTACRLTCASRIVQQIDGRCKPYTGCVCKKGFVRLNDDATGPCVAEDKCPPCQCGYNEEWTEEKYACPPEICQSRHKLYVCPAVERVPKPGCQCIDGHLRNSSNVCIPTEKCPPPPKPPKCPKNEQYAKDTNVCQKTCDNRKRYCDLGPCATVSKCVCNRGLVRLSKDGPCVKEDQCPPSCPHGEHYVNNTNLCEKTCDNRGIYHIMGPCQPFSKCICDRGLIRLKNDGPCAPEDQCPPSDISCGPNEEWTSDKKPCPPEICASRYVAFSCAAPPIDYQPGCICRYGYLRDANDTCIPEEKCPPPPEPGNSCPENEVWSEEKIICPPQSCASIYTLYSCLDTELKKIAGCNCVDGYLRDADGMCVPSEKCPPPTPICGENEVYSDKKITCPPQSCEAASGLINYLCAMEEPAPGCNCKENHLRNADNVCIPSTECPPGPDIPILCGPNEEETDKKVSCPPETCESIGRLYKCAVQKPKKGCKCIKGYLRNAKGECIPKDQCKQQPEPEPTTVPPTPEPSPKCRIPKECRRTCAKPKNGDCETLPAPKIKVDGCECKPGYLLEDVDGKCILEKDCPGGNCDKNSTYKECPSACPPTCAAPTPSRVCNKMCLAKGCECNPGYVLNDGKCIEWKDCPHPSCAANETYVYCKAGCPTDFCPESDSRAQIACSPPYPCPPGCVCQSGYKKKSRNETGCIKSSDCPPVKCTRPNEVWTPSPPDCIRESCNDVLNPQPCYFPYPKPPQCLCKPDHYRNASDICVPVMECGIKCPANQTFAYCSVSCPNDFCPTDDSRDVIACDPPYPCPHGCSCASGYKRKSEKERDCIKSSECPPVKCTRPNEVWNPSPPNCIRDRCEDAVNPKPCDFDYPKPPQCMCKDGHYRNASDICVPVAQCPASCPVPPRCRPTCAVPNPKGCPASTPATTNVDGCQCQTGSVLSAEGKCVKVEECPQDQSCNGDPHARIMANPWSCPATCDSPQASRCDKKGIPVGCVCESGYIYSKKHGKCVVPEKCPAGDPCGPNGTFVDCGFRCPNQYCPQDDSGLIYACKPGRPCPPGCGCKINYLRKSYDDDRCILASECPPVECIGPNEVWAPCPSDCLAEQCENVNDPPAACNTLLLNCQPKCICQEGHYRNSSGDCVPAKECPIPPETCSSDCTPTCAVPNPPDCPPASDLKRPCCESGFILSEKGGKCIPIEDCPKTGCNGDPNAVIRRCPAPSVRSTCDEPESQFSSTPCNPSCECATGYILSEANGTCIKAVECPGGDPCGPDAFFSNCKNSCPTDYCPVDDSRAKVVCETSPFAPCQSGCVCKLNHKLNNREEKKCIVSSDCPPVNCTRPNEVWNPCPSDCQSEYCEAAFKKPVQCNTLVLNCQPRCVCKKKHFRNSKDVCVPAQKCPKPKDPCDD